jgi:hypothetical protein
MADLEEFKYEDEELDEIDYYEIVSYDEIIKFNPTFVAFSNEEIYNYLFSFFNSRTKADSFLKLFTDIIKRQQININANNFIVVADAKRGEFEELDIEDFILKIKNSNKEQIQLAYKNKNKIWFPLIYDDESSKIKFKASSTTIIELSEPNNNDKYIIFKDDERDIPILGVYFYEPVVSNDNYLNEKIVSFLVKDRQKDQMISSDNYKNFEEIIKNYKINLPLHKIDEDEFHYTSINNLFKRFNYDLDTIQLKDYDALKNHLEGLIKKEKEQEVKYSRVEVKENKTNKNYRFYFFKTLKEAIKLIDITIRSAEKLTERLETLQKERFVTEPLPIINDLHKLISSLNEANFDDIIGNLREVRKGVSADNYIQALINFSKNDKDEITRLFEIAENKFNLLFNNYKDLFKISFTFKTEEHEMKKGTDTSSYEGTPVRVDMFKKDTAYIDEEDEEGEEEENDTDKNPYDEFKRYYYNLEKGFSEAIRVVLPYLAKIKEISKLPINYELIINHLFNIYRGIPEKSAIVRKFIGEGFEDDYYKELALRTIKFVLSSDSEDPKLKTANLEYLGIITNMLYDAICKWAIITQTDILKESLLFVKDRCYVPCIHLWNDYGAPYDLERKDGVLYYLLCVFKEIFKEDEMKIDDKYKEIILKKLSDNYKDELNSFNKIDVKKKKRENKGLEAGNKLIKLYKSKEFKTDKFTETFIEALIYMPSYKFENIHKYLKGCCLEQIDENFSADTYLKLSREDLKKAKAKLAEERVLNKPRNKRFFIDKKYEKEPQVPFKPIENFITYDKIYESSLENWFKELETTNKTYLKPSNIIDIKTKTRNSFTIHTTNYLENFFSKNLMNAFNNKDYNCDNYKQILLAVSSNLFIHLQDEALPFIRMINETIKVLDNLSSIINDDNITEIRQIRAIIVIRGLCLPAIPDITTTAKITSSISIDVKISRLIISEIDKKIFNIIQSSKIPTAKEQQDYINKIREENKDKILANLNKKTREEKDLIKEMKKIGFKTDELEESERNVNDERPEDVAEDDYELQRDDGEYEDDNLDGANYSFIYAGEGRI